MEYEPRIYESYKYLKRGNGKLLSAQDKVMFDILRELTLPEDRKGERPIDDVYLQGIIHKSISTIRRVLDNLTPFFKSRYEEKTFFVSRTEQFEDLLALANATLCNLESKEELIYPDPTDYPRKVDIKYGVAHYIDSLK